MGDYIQTGSRKYRVVSVGDGEAARLELLRYDTPVAYSPSSVVWDLVERIRELESRPCPHVVTTDEGTQYCSLSDERVKALEASANILGQMAKEETAKKLAEKARADRLEADNQRLREGMSRCLLNDPPGDCYASEAVELRAKNQRLVAAIEKARGQCGLPDAGDACRAVLRTLGAALEEWQ